jgi:hypothetical protein
VMARARMKCPLLPVYLCGNVCTVCAVFLRVCAVCAVCVLCAVCTHYYACGSSTTKVTACPSGARFMGHWVLLQVARVQRARCRQLGSACNGCTVSHTSPLCMCPFSLNTVACCSMLVHTPAMLPIKHTPPRLIHAKKPTHGNTAIHPDPAGQCALPDGCTL